MYIERPTSRTCIGSSRCFSMAATKHNRAQYKLILYSKPSSCKNALKPHIYICIYVYYVDFEINFNPSSCEYKKIWISQIRPVIVSCFFWFPGGICLGRLHFIGGMGERSQQMIFSSLSSKTQQTL